MNKEITDIERLIAYAISLTALIIIIIIIINLIKLIKDENNYRKRHHK